MSKTKLSTFLTERQDEIISTYNQLHQLAEPSWQEEKTSQFLVDALQKAGIMVKRFDGHYGFIAEIPGEQEEVVGLRADMDALVQEVDGVVKPNHSCGHDAHSTLVLYSALAIASMGITPKKTIRFLFQPAEEKLGGAMKMIEDGALKSVTQLMGVHLRPEMEVPFGKAAPAIFHGATTFLKGTIKGLQAHAARPAYGKNVIEAATVLVQALQNIRLTANSGFSVKMTQLQAGGETSNVIPDRATFTLDVRAQTNEGMDELREKTDHAIKYSGELMGVDIVAEWGGFVPAAVPNESMIKLAEQAITDVLGAENLTEPCVTPGGEDFHFYPLKCPTVQSTMVGLGCGLKPVLHHPNMSFDTTALVYGAQILATAAWEAAHST
ncbi:M20 peptidase aminoacylase family protein [Brevibacillus daliensis]|uniref:M20 peptidase aminoacylase family protein n=1 Tax=Brevibacillus daliensis TaxID=2892995 RepID=UPI001E5B25A9|nr:M20 peptidase aminoacylase family protein [Brevibacillus daliensis]